MKNCIKSYILESLKVKEEIFNNEALVTNINSAVEIIINAYKNNKKVLVAGNGGSAADAQHFSAELVSKFLMSLPN